LKRGKNASEKAVCKTGDLKLLAQTLNETLRWIKYPQELLQFIINKYRSLGKVRGYLSQNAAFEKINNKIKVRHFYLVEDVLKPRNPKDSFFRADD